MSGTWDLLSLWQSNICKEVFQNQPETASNSGSFLTACGILGMFLNLPEPQFPSFVKRANQVYPAGLLGDLKVMKCLKPAAPSCSAICISSKHTPHPRPSLSGLFHLLLQSTFSSPALNHLECVYRCHSELLEVQCPDHQRQSPGEPVTTQIPGL